MQVRPPKCLWLRACNLNPGHKVEMTVACRLHSRHWQRAVLGQLCYERSARAQRHQNGKLHGPVHTQAWCLAFPKSPRASSTPPQYSLLPKLAITWFSCGNRGKPTAGSRLGVRGCQVLPRQSGKWCVCSCVSVGTGTLSLDGWKN